MIGKYSIVQLFLLKFFFTLSSCGYVEESTESPAVTKYPAVNEVFETYIVLGELQKTVRIPIILPVYLPDEDLQVRTEKPFAYASLLEVTSLSYLIDIGATADCEGETACHLGSVSGEAVSIVSERSEGERVQLANNINGYILEANCDGAGCTDASIAWQQGGGEYIISSKAGSREQLIKSANSAIDGMQQ